jgi:hypothetical protein
MADLSDLLQEYKIEAPKKELPEEIEVKPKGRKRRAWLEPDEVITPEVKKQSQEREIEKKVKKLDKVIEKTDKLIEKHKKVVAKPTAKNSKTISKPKPKRSRIQRRASYFEYLTLKGIKKAVWKI